MFKKGDVVEWACDEYGNPAREGTLFSVLVTGLAKRIDEFSGVIVSAQEKADQREGTYLDCWDTKQFKLKQQDVTSNNMPNNTFPVLKDGMVIETRRGRLYVVCGEKFLRPNGFQWKRDYSTEGRTGQSGSDIVKVWSGASLFGLDLGLYAKGRADEIIWKEKKNADKIASLRSQVDALQAEIKQLEEEGNV